MAQNSVKPLQLTTLLSSTISLVYQPINPDGFEQAPFFIRITNGSTMPVLISYDGIDDHEFVLNGSAFDLPSQAGSQPNAKVALFPKHTVVYVRGNTGTGNVTLSGYYV
jgi:hypothetical protein